MWQRIQQRLAPFLAGVPTTIATPSPQFLYIEATTECNLRCKQCHMWLSREPRNVLRTQDKLRLIEEAAALNPNIRVVISGGEPLLKREEFFALTKLCRAHSLRCSSNTNGTLLDDDTIKRLHCEGPEQLIFSLDSHIESLHDWIRGVPGTYRHVMQSIRSLLKHRTGTDDTVRVCTNSILFDRNLGELDDLITFLVDLGVDAIGFQVLSRTFMLQGQRDVFFNRHLPSNPARFDRAIDGILRRKNDGAPIVTSENDLQWMKLYIRNPDFTGEQVCGSAERNVIVNQRGDVVLCFNMHALTNGRPLGNVRRTRLSDILTSQFSADVSTVMGECRLNCGMLGCHRRDAPVAQLSGGNDR